MSDLDQLDSVFKPWILDGSAYYQAKKKKKAEPPPSALTLSPISKDAWAAFDGKAKWDSISALRGPDLLNSSTVKTFTTSVIRFRLSEVMRVGGQVTNWLPFVILPDSPKLLRESSNQFDWSHWLTHVTEAAEWLSIPRALVLTEIWKKSLLDPRTHYVQAAACLANHLQEPFRATLRGILTSYNFGLTEEQINTYAAQVTPAQAPTPEAFQSSEGSL